VGLDRQTAVAVRDQTILACNVYRVVAEHFNRITALAGAVGKYRNHRAFGVIAEDLIDLVTNCKF
jgi:hypothetical protein